MHAREGQALSILRGKGESSVRLAIAEWEDLRRSDLFSVLYPGWARQGLL
jgi:hypothetical protein